MTMDMGKTLALTAVSGMVAGLAGCASSPPPDPETAAPAGEPAAAEAPAEASAKECCAGKNECKGKGGCKGNGHDCSGKNECKGQGGCKPADCGGH
ncbi:MAG TPA: hypothetical protein VL242_42485 [Sorangium sp.]|uniref:Uncharacterized protein n=2 Tax=Sorangium TaxID=39643 RepID=A0A150RZP0_SORCE|nr:hypothetical protein BE17_11975 [Sorangium cellulosum]HTN90439.1 hypothetical protein [Sorangium sp.]